MVLNSYSPSRVAKAVLHLSASCIGICQNQDARSMVQKYLHPPNAPRVSDMFGSG
jgi:hypothetical protein